MKTVLIVDDSKTFQRIMEKILSEKFKIVGKGSSGIEGFDLYKEHKPDLVLMDITMPNCDGRQCLQKILEYNPNALVIMISGVGDEKTVQECLKIGAKAFVNKNVLSKETLETSELTSIALNVTEGVYSNQRAA